MGSRGGGRGGGVVSAGRHPAREFWQDRRGPLLRMRWKWMRNLWKSPRREPCLDGSPPGGPPPPGWPPLGLCSPPATGRHSPRTSTGTSESQGGAECPKAQTQNCFLLRSKIQTGLQPLTTCAGQRDSRSTPRPGEGGHTCSLQRWGRGGGRVAQACGCNKGISDTQGTFAFQRYSGECSGLSSSNTQSKSGISPCSQHSSDSDGDMSGGNVERLAVPFF